ncbi:MAG: MerR family transcriptional regulator [Sarcina sp.]
MKDKYLIGEVCKLFNTTRDTLRYYENIGLIAPKKDKSNGYRYYSVEDLNSLTDIFFLKKLKLPLNDIHKAIKKSTPLDILEMIKDKEKHLQEEMNRIKKLQKTLIAMKINVQACINDLNKLKTIECNENFVFIEITEKNKFEDFIDIVEGVSDIVDETDILKENFLEYVNFTFLIEDGTVFNKNMNDKIKWGVTLRGNKEDLEKRIFHEKLQVIDKKKYIYTVIKLNDIEYEHWLDIIKNIILKNNIKVAEPIIGRMLLTEYDNEIATDYYEVFIPVK